MFLAAEILSQLSEENMEGKREGEASEKKVEVEAREKKVEWEVRGRRMEGEASEKKVEGEVRERRGGCGPFDSWGDWSLSFVEGLVPFILEGTLQFFLGR